MLRDLDIDIWSKFALSITLSSCAFSRETGYLVALMLGCRVWRENKRMDNIYLRIVELKRKEICLKFFDLVLEFERKGKKADKFSKHTL